MHAFGVLLSLEKCNHKIQCKQDETCTLFQTKPVSHIGSYSGDKGVKGRSLKLNSAISTLGRIILHEGARVTPDSVTKQVFLVHKLYFLLT